MKPTRLENLMHALREVEQSIARHQHDDENSVLSDLLQNKALLEMEIEDLQNTKTYERTEETHLHE